MTLETLDLALCAAHHRVAFLAFLMTRRHHPFQTGGFFLAPPGVRGKPARRALASGVRDTGKPSDAAPRVSHRPLGVFRRDQPEQPR